MDPSPPHGLLARYEQIDLALTGWMARSGILSLRVSLGVIFFWFGVLKFFPGSSPAEGLATDTISLLTLGLIEPAVSIRVLAVWECLIGLGLISGLFMRTTLALLFLQMPGTVLPLFLFPELTFQNPPFVLTLEGQYIIKNAVLVSAGLVIGATVRGGQWRPNTPGHSASTAARTALVVLLTMGLLAPTAASASTTTLTATALTATPTSLIAPFASAAAQAPSAQVFPRADTLRGTEGPARAWWDVTYYDLEVTIDPAARTIAGRNGITFEVVAALPASRELQIDLQSPLSLDSVTFRGQRLDLRHEGNAWFTRVPAGAEEGIGSDREWTVTAWYHGSPVVAVNPPWDGGIIWAEDGAGRPWVATANQGLGASVWWPNKDFQGEEPDSQRIALRVPDPMVEVSNGRLRSVTPHPDGTTTYEWFVSSPINNYGIAVNAGSFDHWQEIYDGVEGPLTLDFWPLGENLAAARAQWPNETRSMLRCFEDWFGPYPWYDDGFKMIESPHLGMEHQSAIAYGNGYQNGYLGRDLSGTGQGLAWDFIVVHEAAHEWWGNNITTRDVADMWVHESFANYSENLYTECLTGSERAGAEYVIGTRAAIQNDMPIVGAYGVQNQGSGDMYYKGGNLLHLIRQLVGDDAAWKATLRGLNTDFSRSIVTGADVEAYIASRTGLDLATVFDQYLRTTQVPLLEWSLEGTRLSYRWARAVEGLVLPVDVQVGGNVTVRLTPTETWQSRPVPEGTTGLVVDPDWYVEQRRVEAAG